MADDGTGIKVWQYKMRRKCKAAKEKILLAIRTHATFSMTKFLIKPKHQTNCNLEMMEYRNHVVFSLCANQVYKRMNWQLTSAPSKLHLEAIVEQMTRPIYTLMSISISAGHPGSNGEYGVSEQVGRQWLLQVLQNVQKMELTTPGRMRGPLVYVLVLRAV